jgi:hypothetical protein
LATTTTNYGLDQINNCLIPDPHSTNRLERRP